MRRVLDPFVQCEIKKQIFCNTEILATVDFTALVNYSGPWDKFGFVMAVLDI
jgi:hypothetical protein